MHYKRGKLELYLLGCKFNAFLSVAIIARYFSAEITEFPKSQLLILGGGRPEKLLMYFRGLLLVRSIVVLESHEFDAFTLYSEDDDKRPHMCPSQPFQFSL